MAIEHRLTIVTNDPTPTTCVLRFHTLAEACTAKSAIEGNLQYSPCLNVNQAATVAEDVEV